MSKRDSGLLRRIFFYRLEDAPKILGALPGDLQRIANLPATESGRYLRDADGDRLCVWPDSFEFPLKLKFGRTRLRNLPTKELGGKLESLSLETDAGLAELMHVVIFGDGYVAAEFNFDAPRVKKLGEYLFAKRNALESKPVFLPLFQRDVLALVKAMPTIEWLELTGKPHAQRLLQEADEDLGQAYGTIGALGADKSISLALHAQKRPEGRLKKLTTALARVTQSRTYDVRESITKLKIRGVSSEGKIDLVDLLEDHLVAVKQVEKVSKKDKAVSSASAYRQIIVAYEERKTEFADAAIGRTFR